jgi:hypothetical protein
MGSSSFFASQCEMTISETPFGWHPLLTSVCVARLTPPTQRQIPVSSPGPLQRQKFPDMDGVVAKLETDTASMGVPREENR